MAEIVGLFLTFVVARWIVLFAIGADKNNQNNDQGRH